MFLRAHIAGFNHLTGNSYTRESLSDAVRNDRRVALEYERFLGETFGEALSEFRAALNEASPETNIYYCSCTRDLKFSADFARRLAGAGQKPVIRLNNGRYSRGNDAGFSAANVYDCGDDRLSERRGIRAFVGAGHLSAQSICHFGGAAELPHGRFHHGGCSGSKTLDYAAGRLRTGIRKGIPEYSGLLSGILSGTGEIAAPKAGLGVTMVLPGRKFQTHSVFHNESIDAKVEFVVSMTRLGVPGNYSKASDTVSVLNVEFIDSWSDAEIRAMLARGAILEGSAGPCAWPNAVSPGSWVWT